MSYSFNKIAIDARYSGLATDSCCLSCGSAVTFAEPRPDEVCVDLGSGRGQDVLRMAEQVGPDGFAYGIDVADGMLAKARRSAEKLGVTNVEFLQGEFESLPLPDGRVDLLISNCSINHSENKPAVWAEIHRVLRPGGRFVVSDIYSLDTVPEEYRSDPEAVAECWAGAVTRQEYFGTLEKTGFADVRVIEESQPYDKGQIRVASLTVSGTKPAGTKPRPCCCGG